MTMSQKPSFSKIPHSVSKAVTGNILGAEPAKFHVHTIVRTPNGNDYGVDLLRLHHEQAHH
jgi:hypothetical protein